MKRNKPRRREKATYENRYRHKLNMLWPGQTMLSITGALLLLGILCGLLNWPVENSIQIYRQHEFRSGVSVASL